MAQLKIILALALVFLLFGCTQSNVFQIGTPFNVDQGLTYSSIGENFSIQIISFTDSRCPNGVECIWAGEQEVNLLINRPSVTNRAIKLGEGTIHLGTTTNPKTNFSVLAKTFELSIASIDLDKNFVQLLVSEVTQVACTEEALLCPDGSGVGRGGPNCKFAPCPNCSCPEGFIQEGETCTPSCYYEIPGCLVASIKCTTK